MSGMEEQQIAIFIIKENLEDIARKISSQCDALPALDADNENENRVLMAAISTWRAYQAEEDRLKQQNVKHTSKRIKLQQLFIELTKDIENIYNERHLYSEAIIQEKRVKEQIIIKYEETLQDKAERFRQTAGYYNEEKINEEINKVNSVIAELGAELGRKQLIVDELKAKLDDIHPAIPDQLLDYVGKRELEANVKTLTEKYESLVEKQKV